LLNALYKAQQKRTDSIIQRSLSLTAAKNKSNTTYFEARALNAKEK